ncbi:outer membrane protein [Sphingomonas antarctica]|uniref:outer membrane protein n=1 Tax=Sphingomonas antarctica TaxID=2040274 RepID=UPI0039EA96E8
MRLAIMMFAAGASLSSAAVAQSGDDYSFTGPRAEFLAGYSRQLPSVRTSGPVTTISQAQRHSGGSAGVQGGYDLELGPVVVGVFGGYALLTSQGCGTLGGANQGCLRPQAEAEGGARVGFQVAGRFLAYGKGSYVNTRIQTSNRNGAVIANSHINKDGFRVGGGVEYAVLPRVYVKAEYSYTRTERFNAAPYGFQNTSVSYHDHAGLVGFGIRF